MTQNTYCTQITERSGELLAGTAPSADHFVFITWPKKYWGYEALESKGGFPQGLKAWMKNQSITEKKVTIRLISKPKLDSEKVDMLLFPENKSFLNVSPEDIQGLLESHFLGESTNKYQLVPLKEDHIFVCAHGRHDKCCAKFGQEIADQMKEYVQKNEIPVQIWQSSHLGGHRFTQTLIDFPSGKAYGHLKTKDIADFFKCKASSRTYAPAYRGNVFFSKKNQTIEALTAKYLFEKQWLADISIESVEEQKDSTLKCAVRLDSSNVNRNGNDKQVPDRLSLIFEKKEFQSPAGCDELNELLIRKCWELKKAVPA